MKAHMAQSSTQVPLSLARSCDRTNAFLCTVLKSKEKKASRKVPSTAITQSLQTDNKRCVFFTFLIKARKCLLQIKYRHFLFLTSAKCLSALEVQSDVKKQFKAFLLLLLLLRLLHLIKINCKLQSKKKRKNVCGCRKNKNTVHLVT